jgi:riboflavin transporter FmnP
MVLLNFCCVTPLYLVVILLTCDWIVRWYVWRMMLLSSTIGW